MNLQEILSYRDNCIHCGREMKMHIEGYSKLTATKTDTGLLIKSDKPNGVFLHFHFNGTYERNKRTYEIHKRPIYIRKYCHFHMPSLKEYKGTTIADIKDTSCCYNFILENDGTTYTVDMEYEGIAWNDDKEFWAIDTFHLDNITHIYRGLYSKTIADALHLKLPIANLSSVKNRDQLAEKIKLYTVFS